MDDENKRLIEAVKHYQQNIEKYSGTGNSVKLLHAIERLKRLPVKVSHLQETGVGITVNALRKLGGDVGDSSKALVAKWKEMVLEEEVERREKEERERKDESEDSADDSIEDKENSSENGDSRDNRHKSSNSRDYKKGQKRKERSSSESSINDTNSEEDSEESNSSKNSNEKQKENNQSSDEETYRKDKKKQEYKSKKVDEYRHKDKERRKEETRRRDEHKSKKRCKESSDEENNKKDRKSHEHASKKSQTYSDEERDVKNKENGSKRQHESEATSRNHKKSKHSRDHSEERRKSKKSKHKEEVKDSGDHSSSRSKKEDSKPTEKEKNSSKSKPSKEKENQSHSESSEHKDKKEKHKKEETKSRKSEDTNKSDEKHKKHSDTSKHKSSSAEKIDKNKKEQSKSKKPATTEKIVNGIDSESGASFAEALGMLEAPIVISRSKKKINSESDKPKSRPSTSSSSSKKSVSVSKREENVEEYVPPMLKDKQLEPLDINLSSLLPSITPNYRPLSFPLDNQYKRVLTDDEALSRVMSNKNQRTKVYSGNKTLWNTVPSLFELCTRILQDNIDALEYTGGVPYTILKPILEKANPDQLYMLEHHNPYIIEDSDELWQLHCQKEFRNKRREELESWRDMYMRCLDEREAKLKALTANIKQAQDKSLPVRTTKMAFVDDVVKPPRSVARKQVKNGSATAMKKPTQTPQQRLTQLATAGEAGKVTVPNPGSRAAERSSNSTASIKPKKAPLMAKTLSLFKNRFGRR